MRCKYRVEHFERRLWSIWDLEIDTWFASGNQGWDPLFVGDLMRTFATCSLQITLF